MSIVRVRKDARYFTASNEPFIDKRLSWEARGVIAYLLTKPDNWEIRMEDLAKQGPAKLHKLRRMLSEARLYGYMNRIRKTLPDGTFDWITEVFESPSQNPNPSASVIKSTTGQSRVGLSTSGSSITGKPADIVSTDSISTEFNINERVKMLKKLYENNITLCVPVMFEKLKLAVVEFPDSTWYAPAFEIAAERKALNWSFVYAVLKNWKDKGRDWKPGYNKDDNKTSPAKPAPTPPEPDGRKLVTPEMIAKHPRPHVANR